MSAEIVPFRPPSKAAPIPPRLEAGDLLVTCFNATVGLWCAWPVHSVDRDGVAMGVGLRNGDVMAADRVAARGEAYGFRRADYPAGALDALCWKTWPDAASALAAVLECQR